MWEQQPHGLINVPDILYLFPFMRVRPAQSWKKVGCKTARYFIYIEEGRGEKGKILESPFLEHSTVTQAT